MPPSKTTTIAQIVIPTQSLQDDIAFFTEVLIETENWQHCEIRVTCSSVARFHLYVGPGDAHGVHLPG